jgi:hypothetical protein
MKPKWMKGAVLCGLLFAGSLCADTLTGTVQSGGTDAVLPLSHAMVNLYQADSNGTIKISRVRADDAGHFQLDFKHVAAFTENKIFYVVATKNAQIKLVNILGTHLPDDGHIIINEMTTVGAAYAMAQFFHGEQLLGDTQGLSIAAGMFDNLVSSRDGALSEVIKTSPNADETNSMRSISALSNLLASCVQADACDALFKRTTLPNQTPSNTLEAALNIAHAPAHNASKLFELADEVVLYSPRLVTAPDAWTLAIKFNNSGSEDCPFGGPAKIAFDDKGFAWINNNVIQGTPDSAYCMIVLQPNGQPANGAQGTPKSPITGGGLLGAGFGITIDKKGHVWVGGFGWGHCDGCVPTTGVVSEFTMNGTAVSGSDGYLAPVERAQGVVSDGWQNIWIASAGNDRVVVYPNGDPTAATYYQAPNRSGPFDIAIDKNNIAWVSNSTSSVVSRYVFVGGKIRHLSDTVVGKSLKQISIDAAGHAWVASMRDSTVYELNTEGSVVHAYTGIGGISHPWGVSVDGDQNIWVANFQSLTERPTHFSASKLCGNKTKNCPKGSHTGDAISPATGYTLPTAGSQVLLHDGTPLYGKDGLPSFNPLMRLVSVQFDKAGNAWMANNWKPSALIDLTENPGGDAVVVFVGLAGLG